MNRLTVLFGVVMTEKKSDLPVLPQGVLCKPPKFNYREQFGVIVLCRDEAHHREVYEALKKEGHRCRVVRV